MNVLVLQLDGKLPNLAAMIIAGHHLRIGDHVDLRKGCSDTGEMSVAEMQPRLDDPKWDRVYGSLIFEWSRPLALAAREIYPSILLGGTGWDFEDGTQVRKTDLPPEMLDAAPDYSGHPDVDYSIGFAQRGCRFKCDFCVVPRKEGKVRSVATLEEIWRGGEHARNVMLLDNDFFGNPRWREIVAEALRLDIAISVIQGINARLLTDEQAAAIASVRWQNGKFTRTRVYTAWDAEDDERVFFRGLDRLKAHGISPDSMLVYMLIGHADGEQHEDRDRRRAALREYGARPYPMPYVQAGELGEELRAFARWCVQRKDTLVPWETWWGKARGNVRKLGTRRVSLPLFKDPKADDDDPEDKS